MICINVCDKETKINVVLFVDLISVKQFIRQKSGHRCVFELTIDDRRKVFDTI